MARRLLLAVLVLALAPARARPAAVPAKPRLVVLISIDQFRADYLTRFEDLFVPPRTATGVGGFRYLMERGAWFVDAHHDHIPLATGPGHSIHFTGAPPYKSGIVGNDWYDRTLKRSVYCVEDDSSPIVGTDTKMMGISPEHLRVTTVGDELKMATGGRGKVFGIALKDRAAVLMAGHLADGTYWFDDTNGNWITSRYYRKDGTLPDWVRALNAKHLPAAYLGKQWTLSPDIPADALDRLWVPPGKDGATWPQTYASDRNGIGTAFPHTIAAGKTHVYQGFTTTPFANGFVLDSALELVRQEKLGQDDTLDILAVNLSSNDYIGHAYGPDSAEVLDVTVRTDRQLAAFFNALGRAVPGGLGSVTLVVTADHGAAPNPENMRASGLRAGNWPPQAAVAAAKAALTEAFGEGDWVIGYIEPYLWLNHDALDARHIPHERAEDVAAAALEKLPGIYAAYERHNILAGLLPRTDIARHVSLGFHPEVSGDILLVSQPFWYPGSTSKGTSHAEPYAYDTHVPLLVAGTGVRPGIYTDRVSTLDIAPTLSFLLHVQQPSGCEGRILTPAMASAEKNNAK